MYVFVCGDSFESVMTGIYVAWEKALEVGHDNVRLQKAPVTQMTLFDEYIDVEIDDRKAKSVATSIKNKISYSAFYYIYYASLSKDVHSVDAIYRFLIKGYKMGESIIGRYADEDVMRLFEIKRTVEKEAYFWRELLRFSSISDVVYVAHLEPKNNVVAIVAEHFADRMPSEYFIIVDDIRRIAVVHGKDEDYYLRNLTDEEFESLKLTEGVEDKYIGLWKAFFNAIGIEQRKNQECQRNHFPIWMRKHATEFM